MAKLLTGRLLLGIKNRASKRQILYRAVACFLGNDLIISAAAIAYFGLLMLFPTLLLALSFGQRFFGQAFYQDFLHRLRAFLPGSSELLQRNIEAMSGVSTGILVTSFLVLLWAGSWVFTVIERAMCRIWGTQPRAFWHGRLLTIGMIMAVGLLLIASLMFTSGTIAVEAAATRLSVGALPPVAILGSVIWRSLFAALGLLLTVTLFGLIYYFMPNTKIQIIEVVPGAITAGALWEMAKYAFAWTLPYFHYDLLYGSIGTGVALLTWGYLSSLIMLFGAQLTAVLHCRNLFEEELEKGGEGLPKRQVSWLKLVGK